MIEYLAVKIRFLPV